MRVEKDFKEFIELLNENKVKYLVVGGFAFAYYVEPRFTKDIDIFVESSEENSKKIRSTKSEIRNKSKILIPNFQNQGCAENISIINPMHRCPHNVFVILI